MNFFQISRWLLPSILIIISGAGRGNMLAAAALADKDSPDSSTTPTDEEQQLLQDTIASGRGHRDEPGIRDQWASTDHLQEKFDTRKPISPKVKSLLEAYRLECKSCDETQAVNKINAFVKETKQHAERQAKRQSWLERTVALVTLLVLGRIGYLYSMGDFAAGSSNGTGYTTGGGGMSSVGQARRLKIEEQRRRAAKKEEESTLLAAANEAPTWRENEEQEIWTPKQEKQFARALVSFGGVPPKGRYILIAEKVDGKSRQECLMHHKLLQLIAKEQ